MVQTTLLLTRPRKSAEAFADALAADARAAVTLLVAPLMEIIPTENDPALHAEDRVIFTSSNAVGLAPNGNGRGALCVGALTTRQAALHGWAAQQVGVNAQELIATILAQKIDGPLVHLGGVHTRGDIAQTLTAGGVPTRHVVLYAQNLLPLGREAKAALGGPCIIPVFSPRSAAQLAAEAKDNLRNAYIIALSESVAGALGGENVAKMLVVSAPKADYMRKAVENVCKNHSLP